MAADFVGQTVVDTIRCWANSMLHSVMAKRALWLKPWTAGLASKKNWCKITFDGKALFEEKLNKGISQVTGGKSGLLPQDRKARKTGLFIKIPTVKLQRLKAVTPI